MRKSSLWWIRYYVVESIQNLKHIIKKQNPPINYTLKIQSTYYPEKWKDMSEGQKIELISTTFTDNKLIGKK